ncbi:succinate-semialdehyde dehydrogenase [Rhizoctonia solani AG-1 IA]|uniref:Succinate-semialdehyde dehydrogenase n=1 Tax=Thanatephorus cucumeris (strain AG1-IA) TaxID=983506 RepID=L8X5X5_THACA|nr:succinate-semialdehyde dehydrogenase [Rhizoctonia solani AG-1 IA]
MTSRASSPPLEYTPLEELYAFLETNPELEPILSEIQALESIYLPENIRVWPISLSHPSSAYAKTRFEVVSSLQAPHEDVSLNILVTLLPSYPTSSAPQLQLLSRYIGAFGVDPELSGSVLRTYFSSLTGVAWSPGDIAVFDGIEHVREYQERLSEKTAGQLQREIEKESHTHETAPRAEEPLVKELPAPVELPVGVEFTVAEPIIDRKSVFIGRACRITHPNQVPAILAYLMTDKRITRAAHPIINAWRCTVDGILHQDNDDDGESAAGRGIAHLLQIMIMFWWSLPGFLGAFTLDQIDLNGNRRGMPWNKEVFLSKRRSMMPAQGVVKENAEYNLLQRFTLHVPSNRLVNRVVDEFSDVIACRIIIGVMLIFARGRSALKSPATARFRLAPPSLRLNPALLARMASSTTNFSAVKDQSLLKYQAFIAGQWVDAKDGGKIKVTSGCKVLGTVPELGVDTKKAIEVADEAFKTWSKTTAKERHDILQKMYRLMLDNADDLGLIIVRSNLRLLPRARARMLIVPRLSNGLVGGCKLVETLRLTRRPQLERLFVPMAVIPSPMLNLRNVVVKQPVGVAAILTPWNFPSAMIGRKLAPALAAGCTVVIKPPAETPFSALALIARRAGVPDGVINVVTTDKNIKEVGQELCESKIIKKVTFTGSTPVAKILSKQASSTLKKVSWEAGGNAPFIVFDDADIEKAVDGAIACKFRGSGQTCVCANRIYVQSSVYADFAARLAEKVDAFKLGNGIDPATLVWFRSLSPSGVEAHVNDAVSRGASVLVGGKRAESLGPNFFEPTVLADVPPDAALTDEETFGPVAALIKFETEDEVIRLANNSDVGLAGYFFSRDVGRVWRVAEALEVGMVGTNTGLISQAQVPFGGIKESGLGREGGPHGIDEYMNTKLIVFGGL